MAADDAPGRTIRAATEPEIVAVQDISAAAGARFAGVGMHDVAADPPLS